MRAAGWRDFGLRALSLIGVASLAYLLGAAVVYFKLPTSGLLDDAFTGGRAWNERRAADHGPADQPAAAATVTVDKPAQTSDGYTAYTTDRGSHAVLVNMRGDVVHRWAAPFREIWPSHAHIADPVAEGHIYWFDCHVYPNGDLLAVLHGSGDTPYGYGLVKLDKDSRVLWTYAANVHHSVDVSDDGTIHVLTQKLIHESPDGLKWLVPPCLVDALVRLSPDGMELASIPILEAFRDSPYSALLTLQSGARLGPAWDVLHTNRATVLTKELAPRFPRFKAGQVLISVRELDTLAVIDPERRAVVWAARGPWRGQHDAQFLDNGRFLLFDNRGSSEESRVLEYDPNSQACAWICPDETGPSFIAPIQGRAQRLANGNTLIVDSVAGELHEVTRARAVVWSCACHAHVPWARRYRSAQLPFVKGTSHVRP